MKTSPYYSNDEDKAKLVEGIKGFSFDAVTPQGLTIVLAGKEGSGKTHMAMTMHTEGPVYVLDTEKRAWIVGAKFGVKAIKQISNYKELVIAVKAILKMPKGTIVIDSGSDLQDFAEIEYLTRTKQEKVYPIFNWSEIWAMLNALLDDIKDAGFNCIVTAKIKDEYANDKVIGKIPRVYKNMPYRADLVIVKTEHGWTTQEEFGGKNGFSRVNVTIDPDSLPNTINNTLLGDNATGQETIKTTKAKRF